MSATEMQQPDLKALAYKVLQRNYERNQSATKTKKECNLTPLNYPEKLHEVAHENERTETKIRAWLHSIGETDAAIIAETLGRCKNDPEIRTYFLRRAKKEERSVPDNRHLCCECSNLADEGICREGVKVAGNWHYRPLDDIPRRCEYFLRDE